MRLAIVGLGPSAKGMGEEIDAHDIVVRIKAYWKNGAEDAGEKLSVWATYPDHDTGATPITEPDEIWYTQCPGQIERAKRTDGMILSCRNNKGVPWEQLTDGEWTTLRTHLGKDPSTGFVAVAMAISRFPDCELSLYGFDSTIPELDTFWDARRPENGKDEETKLHHGILREKRSLAEMGADGRWLGEPCRVTLNWPCMPEGLS